MTREDRINGLILLDEKINSELLNLQSNLEEILKNVSSEDGHGQYLSRISYIQTLFDRASEIIRETPLGDSDINFFEALKAKDRIATNYIKFNRIKNQIEQFLNKDLQAEEASMIQVIQSVQQIIDEPSEKEISSEDDQNQNEMFFEEQFIEDEKKAKQKKKPVQRKSDAEKQRFLEEERRYQENQLRMENDFRNSESNKMYQDNTYEQPQYVVSYPDYQNPYSTDYPDGRLKKPVSAADLRDEQYREEEKRAAEREEARARRQERHEKFLAYQDEQRSEIPEPETSVPEKQPQNISSLYSAPENQPHNQRPEKPVTAADLRDEQYREEEKRAAEREEARARRQERHDKFTAYQDEHRPTDMPSTSDNSQKDTPPYNNSYVQPPGQEQGKPNPSYVSRHESHSSTDNGVPNSLSGSTKESYKTLDNQDQIRGFYHNPSGYVPKNPSRPLGYTFTPSGTASVDIPHSHSKDNPGKGSFQGIPIQKNNKYNSSEKVPEKPVPEKLQRSPEKPRTTPEKSQGGTGAKKTGERQTFEVNHFGYTPSGWMANKSVNGVMRRNHTTVTSSKSASSSRPKSTDGSKTNHSGDSKQNGKQDFIPVPRKAGSNNSHKTEPNRQYAPFGSTGQSKRGNANKTQKNTVKEPGTGLGKHNSHLRSKAIASSYAKAMGGTLVRYAGGAATMGARKLYSMLQEGDNNILRGFETSRYYGMAAVGAAKALANRKVISSGRTERLASKYERSHFKKYSKMSGKEISKEINQNLQKNRAAKAEIRKLMDKGSSLTTAERRELMNKIKEHHSAGQQSRKAYKVQALRRQSRMEVEMSKAFEKRANGRRVTAKVIDKELKNQRLVAEKAMKKKFGDLTKVSNRSLAKEIKSLKKQGKSLKDEIKLLQGKGSSLTAVERKRLLQLKKQHKAVSARTRKLIGLQQARKTLNDKMKFGMKARKQIAKNSFAIKNGLFALQRSLISTLNKTDEIGVQGIAKAVNISTNRYVHAFIKKSLRASWGLTKFGFRVTHLDKVAKAVGTGTKNIVKKTVSKATNKALVKTGRTAGKMASRLTQRKVKTLTGQTITKVLKKPHALSAKKLFQSAAKGSLQAASYLRKGMQALSTLLKGVSLKAIAIVLAFVFVVGMIGAIVSSIGSSAGTFILSPDSSDDGKFDLGDYYDIIIDEWDNYVEDLNDIGQKENAEKIVINMDPIPDNVREILSMTAVRMNQNMDLDENDEIEPYLQYLTQQLNPYSKVVDKYYCEGCKGEDNDYCPGHKMITFTISSLYFGPLNELDDPIFSADEMGNAGQSSTTGGLIGRFKITHYCTERYEHTCNAGPPYQTATGTNVTPGRTIAVDPSVIPLGSHVIIDGHEYIAEDTGGAIKGNRIDIAVDTHDKAMRKGTRNNVPVYAVSYEGEDIVSSGKWKGWTDGNRQWAKTIYYQNWQEIYSGLPILSGFGNNTTDLSGVDFVDGERTGNQRIVDIAKQQEGYSEGAKFYKWYGFDSHVHWCATFVSWCANQAGVLNTAIPKFASCSLQGAPWFQNHGQWAKPGDITPVAGDIIFFDWQVDGRTDHVGIVIGSDGSKVYTVEGNTGNSPGIVKVKSYSLNYKCIYGYGIPNY